jgi:hypothetical protein
MVQQIELHKLSEIELKAFAFDQVNMIDLANHNLKVIHEELAKRAKAAQQIEKSPEPTL